MREAAITPGSATAQARRVQLRPSGARAGAGRQVRPSAVPAGRPPGVLRGAGQPLPAPLRRDMEGRLGADFSDVRLHTGAAARASAAAFGARAYTFGSHVVIGDGGADKHTLAHELSHVIQQRHGPVTGTDHGSGLKVSDPSDVYERAAEANATRVMRVSPNQGRAAVAGISGQDGPVVHPGAGPQHTRAAAPVLQRAGSFGNYAQKKIGHPNNRSDKAIAALATLLDHNEYERREQLEDKDFVLNQNETAVGTLMGAGRFLYENNVNPTWPTEVLIKFFRQMLQIARAGNYSEINWGPLHGPGSGTWVEAKFYPGGHPEGSNAGGDPRWMLNLEQRRNEARSRTLYARGHLLNRHLGGPGLDYNMVPLTAGGDWGANDANGAHSSLIEETVKKKFDLLDSQKEDRVTNLAYRVKAHYGRTARPQTQTIAKLTGKFREIILSFAKLRAEERQGIGDKATDQEVQNAWNNAYGNLNAPVAPYPGREQAIAQLALHFARGDLKTRISWLPLIDKWWVEYQVNTVPFLKSVLGAVSGNYKLRSLYALDRLMRENAQLWQHEDQWVPSHLEYEASWEEFGQQQKRADRVVVNLPTALNAAFDPRDPKE